MTLTRPGRDGGPSPDERAPEPRPQPVEAMAERLGRRRRRGRRGADRGRRHADRCRPRAPWRVADLRRLPGRARRETSRSNANAVTALIGPSGCGKSTLLRTLNRMNDLVPGSPLDGGIVFDGQDLYGEGVDPVEVRRRIGMVFQKPNPFPKSIYDNVAFGPQDQRLQGQHGRARRASLRRAALWDEVKDKLKQSGLALSGGQQQRLCIARAIAVEPEVILMDEPCSALDPRSTLQIEELMAELKQRLHDRHRDPQHAAGRTGLGPDGVHDHGRGSGGLHRRGGRHGADLHEPQEPAHRGLRLRAVRMSGPRPTHSPTPSAVTVTARPAACRPSEPIASRAPPERRSAATSGRDQGRRPAHGLARRGARSAPRSRRSSRTTRQRRRRRHRRTTGRSTRRSARSRR